MGVLELNKYSLWDEGEVTNMFGAFDDKILALISKEIHKDSRDNSKLFGDWLRWCKKQSSRLKVIEHDVPTGILPKQFEGTLYDIKVQGKKWAPDDALYNDNEDLRYQYTLL